MLTEEFITRRGKKVGEGALKKRLGVNWQETRIINWTDGFAGSTKGQSGLYLNLKALAGPACQTKPKPTFSLFLSWDKIGWRFCWSFQPLWLSWQRLGGPEKLAVHNTQAWHDCQECEPRQVPWYSSCTFFMYTLYLRRGGEKIKRANPSDEAAMTQHFEKTFLHRLAA